MGRFDSRRLRAWLAVLYFYVICARFSGPSGVAAAVSREKFFCGVLPPLPRGGGSFQLSFFPR
jgi:hypothetical protein